MSVLSDLITRLDLVGMGGVPAVAAAMAAEKIAESGRTVAEVPQKEFAALVVGCQRKFYQVQVRSRREG